MLQLDFVGHGLGTGGWMLMVETVITDPDNPNFDLEKYLSKVA